MTLYFKEITFFVEVCCTFYFGSERSLRSIVSLRAVNICRGLESLKVDCVKPLPFINGDYKLY